MTTLIYSDCKEFLSRADKKDNGVSTNFAMQNPEYVKENESNYACWNCSECSSSSNSSNCFNSLQCKDSSNCARCVRITGSFNCLDSFDLVNCTGLQNSAGKENNKNKELEEKKEFTVPVLKHIHTKLKNVIEKEGNIIDMSDWHLYDSVHCKVHCKAHCRAGWVVTLAGKEGKELEYKTSTSFAAMQIYDKSSTIKVPHTRFYDTDKKSIEDIKRCAELELKMSFRT